ncbi:hypothetical protein [Serratia fonticola]|uniref:hypothetical protein n=1 Tax=Serratia fonticola TaxID=47917 RepID=UPI00301CDBE1
MNAVDKYEPAGVVHRGEFVVTKVATQRIGVDNRYAMMPGYATGGLVGNAVTDFAPIYGLRSSDNPPLTVNAPVTINQQGGGQTQPVKMTQLLELISKLLMHRLGRALQGSLNQAGRYGRC